MSTLPEFIKQHEITAKAKTIDDHPSIDWSDDRQKAASHWRVTLLRKWAEVYSLTNEHGDLVNGHTDKRAQMTVIFHMGSAHRHAPTTADVLSSVISDASGADQPFDDWCADLGYDTDSRKAERIYKACQREARRLRQFLGNDLFQAALYDVEPY